MTSLSTADCSQASRSHSLTSWSSGYTATTTTTCLHDSTSSSSSSTNQDVLYESSSSSSSSRLPEAKTATTHQRHPPNHAGSTAHPYPCSTAAAAATAAPRPHPPTTALGSTCITYRTVMDVTLSWDAMKRKAGSDFEGKLGHLIFARVFELEPKARRFFEFGSDDNDDELSSTNPIFMSHVHAFLEMLDVAVSFLGPDLHPLAQDMYELGQRHVRYCRGISAVDYLPVMERAVMYAFEEATAAAATTTTKDKTLRQDEESSSSSLSTSSSSFLTKNERHAWQTFFTFILHHMTRGMRSKR